MDYLGYLRGDYERLAAVAEPALTAKVPTCPDWTVDALVNHVAHVYLHKVECMRHNAAPDPWPPGGTEDGPRLELLHRGFRELSSEFSSRRVDSAAFTWYEPDQSVGFWQRRMAHETVIHRIDGELAAGAQSLTVSDELAIDGIDELLTVFLAWSSVRWAEDFDEVLSAGPNGSAGISAGGRRWHVTWTPEDRVRVGETGEPADVELSGTADAMLRWLWRRAPGGVAVNGDESKAERLQVFLAAATQ